MRTGRTGGEILTNIYLVWRLFAQGCAFIVSLICILIQGTYNSGKPGKLRDILILENSGKFEIYSGNFWKLCRPITA